MLDTGVRASVPNDEPKEVATLGAFERPHFVPSGNQRDLNDDPLDIASDALGLGIHGAPIPLVGAPAFWGQSVTAWFILRAVVTRGLCSPASLQ
jgi:hypothetical protein